MGATVSVDRRGRFAVVVRRFRGQVLVVPLDSSPVHSHHQEAPLAHEPSRRTGACSATGYQLEPGPFPEFAKAPVW